MESFPIRLATVEDLPAIVGLANWAAAHTTANFALEPESVDEWRATYLRTERLHAWLVAVDAGEVVGFAKTSPLRSRAAYDWTAETTIYLRDSHFGRGLGTQLYTRLLAIAAAQGYVALLAGITAGHAASEALHRKLGFQKVAHFARLGWKFGAWHDVGYWELLLADEAPPRPILPVATVLERMVL